MPPRIPRSSSPVLWGVVAALAAVLGSGAVLFFFDPSRHGFYPVCVFHELTGWNCPGCGATRAAYQLLHGHLLLALRDNALFVLTLAALAGWGGWQLVRKTRNRPISFRVPARVGWGFLILALVFTVLRNLPDFAWLSP